MVLHKPFPLQKLNEPRPLQVYHHMKVYSPQSVEIWLDQGYVFKSHRCSKYQSVRVLEQNQLFQ